MNKIFEITGIIVWMLIVSILVYVTLGLIYQQWNKVKSRTWAYQIWEYIRLKKNVAKWRVNGFANVNMHLVKYHRAALLGKVKGREYRTRNLFKKQIIAFYDDMLNSERNES